MRTWLAGVFLVLVSVSHVHAFEEKALKNLKAFNKCKKCDLSGADLHRQYLKKAGLTESDLRGANLKKAKLSWFMYKAKLGNADLSHADLTGADLRAGNLKGANLTGQI